MLAPMPDELPGQSPDFAAKFLQNVRGAIPLTIEQIDAMLQLIAAARGESIGAFLDLGCGDGFLSSAILDDHPQAHGVLVDVSTPVLSAARRQLQAHVHRLEFLETDFRQPAWVRRVAPHAPFDTVVSAFALRHLPDARKKALFGEILELLAPEGIFINIEHVSSATRWTDSVLDDYMIDAVFGRELKAAHGKTRADVARDYYARATNEPAIVPPLEVQCDWLRELGYENVECYLKVLELAVFGGQKPAV